MNVRRLDYKLWEFKKTRDFHLFTFKFLHFEILFAGWKMEIYLSQNKF